MSSSDEFEESKNQKRSLRRDPSRSEEKRRRQMASDHKEGSVGSEEEEGVGHALVEMERGDMGLEEESVLANTVVTKNGSVLTLPELNPPPEAVSRSMRVGVGCGLCSRRDTSDMVWCNRCGSEFHARCLYGDELDYNSWLCSECVSVLSDLSPAFAYLQAGSEYVPANGYAPMGCPVRVSECSVSVTTVPVTTVPDATVSDATAPETSTPETSTHETSTHDNSTPVTTAPDNTTHDNTTHDNTTHANREKQRPFLTEKKRLQWLLSFGEKLVGSRVWLKERGLMGFVLFRMTDLLLFYVAFEGVAEGESGWYALEQGEVSVLRELVWVRGASGVGCGVKEEVMEGASGRVLDLERGELVAVCDEMQAVRDWREHRLELAFNPLLETVRWEFHLGDQVRKCVSKPFKVPSQRVELSGKEWMYKWVYVWKREVEFPFGGWSRGVVLQYRSMTGKHFVLFESDSVHSGWMYLNAQYVLVDGVSNEELMALQPASEEHCWCCLRGASEQPLYRCVKCGLFCHLACSDPARGGELSAEEAKEFVCFKCAKCRGCGTEVSFYGRWERASLCGERVLCCEECKERYGEGLFCDVCLKTMGAADTRACLKCSACGKWVHPECDGVKKEGRRREDSAVDEAVGSDEEKADGGASYRCPSCRREDMKRMVSALKAWDPAGIFVHPISEEFAPNYYDLIPREKSVCFDVMEARIRRKAYDRVQQVREDFELMCANAFVYNAVGDEVWKCTETLFEKGEAYLESDWRETRASEYVEKIATVRASKTKLSTRPEASTSAKQASLEASKMVRYIEECKLSGGKLEACTPLAGPYSVVEVPMVAERILPRYSSTISYDVCLSCGSSGDRDRMLFCADCGECYHVYCVNLSGTVTHEMRCGWRCSNCKVCEVCGAALTSLLGNGEVVCSCNRCDRSFHKACLQYTDEENLNLFVCGHCFACKKCGKRGSATTWSYHKDYCRECYAKEERFRECAVCGKPWSSSDVDMAFCESCEQWIHRRCIASDMLEWQKCDLTRTPYHCKRCRQQEELTAGAAMVSLASSHRGEEGVSVQRGLVSEIQELRQELRVKELLQQETGSRMAQLAQLEGRWRELVRTIIRVVLARRSEA